MQVADVVLNNIAAPAWVFHVLLLFLACGFPLAIFFAWAFELTPDGLKREHKVDGDSALLEANTTSISRTVSISKAGNCRVRQVHRGTAFHQHE